MTKEEMQLNAKLQQKKNALRKDLSKLGVLKREGNNKFSNYKYFSESQYKELFTRLFAEHGLELHFNELDYQLHTITREKESNLRVVKFRWELTDIETGYSETTVMTSEGADSGDKGGYKAYTGALKYYLANTFMVATGDDPERDDREPEKKSEKKTLTATPEQINFIKGAYKGDKLKKLLEAQNVEKVEDIPLDKASDICKKVKEIIEKKESKKNGVSDSNEQSADDEQRGDSGDNQSEV